MIDTIKELPITLALAARETPIWCLADDRHLKIVLRSVEPADDHEMVAAFDPSPSP